MNARDFMNRYKLAGQKVNMYRAKIEALEQSALSGQQMDGQPHGSGKSDTVPRVATKAADMRVTLEAWMLEQERIQEEIIRVMGALKKTEHFQVLKMRYIEEPPADSWQSIAAVMDKTVRHVQRIHGYALQEVQLIIGEMYPEY